MALSNRKGFTQCQDTGHSGGNWEAKWVSEGNFTVAIISLTGDSDPRCRWITVDTPQRGKINSVQNSRLLQASSRGFFSLAYEQQWIENNYGRWITVDPPQRRKINSVQNSRLLQASFRGLFDQYLFFINPDVRFFCYPIYFYI
jgi:hypothetical protein